MLLILFLIIAGVIAILFWDSIEKNVKDENILNIGAGIIVFAIPAILLLFLFIHLIWPLVVAGLGVTLVANTWRSL